jgi:ATP-dependent DNA helicase RecG
MENSFIIDNLLQQKESERLEFKTSFNTDTIAKTITAFINTQGGDLIVGVDNDKKIVGVHNADEMVENLQNFLVESIKPLAPIAVQKVIYKNRELVLVSVWEGARKPYTYNNTIYNRAGQLTKSSKENALNVLISDRKQADFNWERMAVLGAELEDLDFVEINKTISSYLEYKKEAKFLDVEDFLIQLGLIQNGNITNACMVLFGKHPTRFIPQSKIRITVYPGSKSSNSFIDDKIFDGNIFKNINEVLQYIEAIFGKSIKVEGILREERKNFPELAFREGILNAIVHRDYNSVNGFLQISIYENKTEISNFGGLLNGITLQELKTEHHSILRNPDIAQICFIRKYIEMLGSGTLRIIKDCKKNKFKPPVWSENDNVLKLAFPGVFHSKKYEGVNEGVNEGVKLNIEGVNEGVKLELISILNALNNQPMLKVPEIASKIDKGISTVERYMKILKENNLVEFAGAPKTGGYIVKK